MCGKKEHLQILGHYYRIRHYDKLINGKSTFFYHQQSRDYIDSLKLDHSKNENTIDHLTTNIDLKLLNNGSIIEKNNASIAQSVEQQPCKL